MGWHIDDDTKEAIEGVLRESVRDPVGPEFMAPSEIPAERPASQYKTSTRELKV
jgi:hypothetical protein